jgi:hypothetical protein
MTTKFILPHPTLHSKPLVVSQRVLVTIIYSGITVKIMTLHFHIDQHKIIPNPCVHRLCYKGVISSKKSEYIKTILFQNNLQHSNDLMSDWITEC